MKSAYRAGQQIGWWTLLAHAPMRGGRGGYWKARCACGAEHVVLPYDIVHGKRRSCGCWRNSPEYVARRLWANVDKSGGPDACWLWTACITLRGYGTIGYQGRPQPAHRVAWILTNGPIPQSPDADFRGLCVCHRCDNRRCVNPPHLFLGTHAENMRDMVGKGRQIRGAALSPYCAGERNGNSKLTASAVAAIRNEYAAGGVSQAAIARRYGVSNDTVNRIIRRIAWTAYRPGSAEEADQP